MALIIGQKSPFPYRDLHTQGNQTHTLLSLLYNALKSYTFSAAAIGSEHLLFHYHMQLGVKIHSNIYVLFRN